MTGISLAEIERDFEATVCRGVRLLPEGSRRYRVFTPFSFDDGDLLSVVLLGQDHEWLLSDEGSTYMRLSYWLDERAMESEGRHRIIDNALSAGGIEDMNGELVARIQGQQYGGALYSLVQTILRISDVSLQTREQVRATFVDDVGALIERVIPPGKLVRKWHEPKLDPKGHYPVDWLVRGNGHDPIFVFALQTEEKVKDVTIILHQFERWDYKHRTVAVFQQQEGIPIKDLARFTDVAEKSYSTLEGNENRIEKYLREAMGNGHPER
jgi:hypothetical protein